MHPKQQKNLFVQVAQSLLRLPHHFSPNHEQSADGVMLRQLFLSLHTVTPQFCVLHNYQDAVSKQIQIVELPFHFRHGECIIVLIQNVQEIILANVEGRVDNKI